MEQKKKKIQYNCIIIYYTYNNKFEIITDILFSGYVVVQILQTHFFFIFLLLIQTVTIIETIIILWIYCSHLQNFYSIISTPIDIKDIIYFENEELRYWICQYRNFYGCDYKFILYTLLNNNVKNISCFCISYYAGSRP